MLTLSNGKKIDFACAAGALGYDGCGWPWEWPLRWLGILRPDELTIITKSLTCYPRRGNLRWWCPWRCVRLIPGGAVNAVGLTNPGIRWWIREVSHRLRYPTIVSIAPDTPGEVNEMMSRLQHLNYRLVAIQMNLSCPNVEADRGLEHATAMVRAARDWPLLPLIVKLGWRPDLVEICRMLQDNGVEAVELINTVPWTTLHPDEPSPLHCHGLMGGVSGQPITAISRQALSLVRSAGLTIPVISGGGISNVQEILLRHTLGAKACSLGTVFLRSPWVVRDMVREARFFLN